MSKTLKNFVIALKLQNIDNSYFRNIVHNKLTNSNLFLWFCRLGAGQNRCSREFTVYCLQEHLISFFYLISILFRSIYNGYFDNLSQTDLFLLIYWKWNHCIAYFRISNLLWNNSIFCFIFTIFLAKLSH